MKKGTPQHLICPISGLYFYDPVCTNNGQTFEREEIEKWIQQCKTSKKPITCPNTNSIINDILTPNVTIRGLAREYTEEHPELFENDKVYLPQSLKLELISAIQSGDCKLLTDTLGKDPRLIKVGLNAEGDSAFILSCKQGYIEVFSLLLKKLPANKIESLKIGSEETFTLAQTLTPNLKLAGLKALAEHLKFDTKIFFTILAFRAVNAGDIELLKIVLEDIDVNVYELQNRRTLLHTAVLAHAKKLQDNPHAEITEEELCVLRALFSVGANAKIVDKDNFTPSQLALKLGLITFARALDTERRALKLAPFINPLQHRLSTLESRNNILEQQNAAQALLIRRLEQKVVELEVGQSKQLAVSQALANLEEQKKIKAFLPSIVKSFNLKDKIKNIMAVGQNHLVCSLATKDQHNGVSSLAIIDMRQPANQSILRLIQLGNIGYNNSGRFSFIAVDDTRFIYCHEIDKNDNKKVDSVKLVMWNISLLKEENTFTIPYRKVNLIQIINRSRLLISGSKNYETECAILDLKSGNIQPHKHLEIVDYSEWHSHRAAPTSFNTQIDLAYIAYEKERNRSETPKELRLYNCETQQNTFLTTENISDFERSSSRVIFKFVSPEIIAISNRSQYQGNDNVQLRLFNIKSKQFIQTFSPPRLKSSGFNTPIYQGFSDACMVPGNILAAVFDDPESKNSTGSKLIMWDLQTSQVKYTIAIEGEAKYLIYDEIRQVLCCSNENSIQVFEIYPKKLNSPSALRKVAVSESTTPSGRIITL